MSVLSEQNKELLVFGYTRRQSNELDLMIPKEILTIFVSFYRHLYEVWDVKNSTLSVNVYPEDETCAKHNNSARWFNAFGVQTFGNNDYKEWKLKLNFVDSPCSMRIGIVDANELIDIEEYNVGSSFDKTYKHSYSLSTFDGYFWYHKRYDSFDGDYWTKRERLKYLNSVQIKDGDIIHIILDLTQHDILTLRYGINGSNFDAIKLNKIDHKSVWKLAVASMKPSDTITIVQ